MEHHTPRDADARTVVHRRRERGGGEARGVLLRLLAGGLGGLVGLIGGGVVGGEGLGEAQHAVAALPVGIQPERLDLGAVVPALLLEVVDVLDAGGLVFLAHAAMVSPAGLTRRACR